MHIFQKFLSYIFKGTHMEGFALKYNTLERCEEIGMYIVETGATVRAAAARFGISKSTVHKDITEKLYTINRSLHEQVHKVLERNKLERHLRGGVATREKYRRSKEFDTQNI